MEKHNVINTVRMEMERMFGVLDVYYLPDMEDHHRLLRTIEASIKDAINKIDEATVTPSENTLSPLHF